MSSPQHAACKLIRVHCAADLVPVSAKATSGDKGKFEASVKSVLIGKVPDRGGRPFEGRAAAAAASMPAWAPRQSDGTSMLQAVTAFALRAHKCVHWASEEPFIPRSLFMFVSFGAEQAELLAS